MNPSTGEKLSELGPQDLNLITVGKLKKEKKSFKMFNRKKFLSLCLHFFFTYSGLTEGTLRFKTIKGGSPNLNKQVENVMSKLSPGNYQDRA